MNTQVQANGMQVIAKTDETFLLISKTNTTASAIQGEDKTSVDYQMGVEDSTLYASAPCLTTEEADLLPAETGKKVGETPIVTAGAQVKDTASAALFTNWYTAKANDAGHSTMKEGSARQLTTFTGYVVTQVAYITVAEGANPAKNLTVSATFRQNGTGTDVTAAKVLVTTDKGGFAVLDSNHTSANIYGTPNKITDQDVVVVTMYIYYDGNEGVVYTNNSTNLKGAKIDLAFDVVADLS